jgi:hypothetical protein
MKKLRIYVFLPIIFLSIFACSKSEKSDINATNEGLEIIKIDLSEAREGKLSEFFEPEIEYIWLKDDSEDAQLSAGLHKIIFHEDQIMVLDIFGCRCIKVFDRKGKFVSKIRAYGEGPKKYLDFDDAIIVNNELLMLGVHPPKLMWFSLEGEFLREVSMETHIETGVYLEKEKRYLFYSNPRDPEDYFVKSVNESFLDTLGFFPYDADTYYGNYSGRDNLVGEEAIYFARPFHDTIMIYESGKFIPKLVFNFGSYAQSIEELKRNKETLDGLEELKFINKKAKLYFAPMGWYISNSQFYSGFKYEEGFFNVFFDRAKQKTHILKGRIKDDINEGFDLYSVIYRFDQEKVGCKIPGKDLFKILQKKKAELGQDGFEEYVKGKGKNFAEAAFAAKDSENPVLIVYTVKK